MADIASSPKLELGSQLSNDIIILFLLKTAYKYELLKQPVKRRHMRLILLSQVEYPVKRRIRQRLQA